MVTLNDPVYVEAAEALAKKANDYAPNNPEKQIEFAYQQILFKPIPPQKKATLMTFYNKTIKDYESEPELMKGLIKTSDNRTPEYAALINTTSILLNLDEFLNKT